MDGESFWSAKGLNFASIQYQIALIAIELEKDR